MSGTTKTTTPPVTQKKRKGAAASDSPDAVVPPKEPKDAGEDGINRTLNTQADPTLSGVPASKCVQVFQYIRFDEAARSNCDRSIQKPKKSSNEEWKCIAVQDRTLWVMWKRALKEAELEPVQYPYSSFKQFVKDEDEELKEFVKSREEKLKKIQDNNNTKINRVTKQIDRKLRETLRGIKNTSDGIKNTTPVTASRKKQKQSPPSSPAVPPSSPSLTSIAGISILPDTK